MIKEDLRFFSQFHGESSKEKDENSNSSHTFIDEPFLDALDEWVWEMDMKGIHTYSNGAVEKILGYKVEEVVGYSTIKLWTKKNSAIQQQKLASSLASGKGWSNYSAYFMHKDGSLRILLSSAVPIYDKKNELVGYRGIDRDITERVLNENLLKAQKKHTKLINQVLRHDLTNNLSVINSSIRLFESTDEKKYLEEIKKSIDRSIKLIRGMRESEKLLLQNTNLLVFNSREVFENVLYNRTDIEYTIEGKNLILADEMIYSVFENIINNAIIHGKADKIDIDIYDKKVKSIITIADNGIGVPDEIKDKLFDEGFKYGSRGNTGMGLYIVKKAMEKYKGEVFVENNSPQGTIFKLIFHRIAKDKT
ncbi:MAG: PAS domain-containing sensor histidine kinase [Candidatus Cloacimonetes bacterium]|nr:PAS domain-containing sensor histidine kinase [Candidatus Cloacimonadota bacterium]MCF7815246.1 PAS domain-containing sensor histidine kinase [Candidatus Cloacimonadota bacterium]MCF7868472.1 PAS domain-containing sensor histidine kinase [Candidatus Cloacimonadota bacterium]MCF7883908.1 PAS domain-containing sensor histidine kinase [Candidatus Cloacimonadota bacterium]